MPMLYLRPYTPDFDNGGSPLRRMDAIQRVALASFWPMTCGRCPALSWALRRALRDKVPDHAGAATPMGSDAQPPTSPGCCDKAVLSQLPVDSANPNE